MGFIWPPNFLHVTCPTTLVGFNNFWGCYIAAVELNNLHQAGAVGASD